MNEKMNTVPIDHCSFITCPECNGSGVITIDIDAHIWDYCELCGGTGEYLELDYAEDGYEVIEDE